MDTGIDTGKYMPYGGFTRNETWQVGCYRKICDGVMWWGPLPKYFAISKSFTVFTSSHNV